MTEFNGEVKSKINAIIVTLTMADEKKVTISQPIGEMLDMIGIMALAQVRRECGFNMEQMMEQMIIIGDRLRERQQKLDAA